MRDRVFQRTGVRVGIDLRKVLAHDQIRIRGRRKTYLLTTWHKGSELECAGVAVQGEIRLTVVCWAASQLRDIAGAVCEGLASEVDGLVAGVHGEVLDC